MDKTIKSSCRVKYHAGKDRLRGAGLKLMVSPGTWVSESLLRRVQALLDLQTVNAQKNLAKEFKSRLDKMIRSDFVHQTAWAR